MSKTRVLLVMTRKRVEEHEENFKTERKTYDRDIKDMVSAGEELRDQFRKAQSTHGERQERRLQKKRKDQDDSHRHIRRHHRRTSAPERSKSRHASKDAKDTGDAEERKSRISEVLGCGVV
jgi:hypothetical protein